MSITDWILTVLEPFNLGTSFTTGNDLKPSLSSHPVLSQVRSLKVPLHNNV